MSKIKILGKNFLKAIMDDMHCIEVDQQKEEAQKEELVNDAEIKETKEWIMEKAKSFDGTPFTIQRFFGREIFSKFQ